MKIAICEDEEIMAKKLWNLFVDDPETEADYFLNPLELLKHYDAAGQYQILFCDASMEPMDGIALCRKIREFDRQIYIVFVTNYIEFAPAGYELGLFRYLLKPVTKEAVDKAMEEIKADMNRSDRFLLKTPECSMLLDWQDIFYLEVDDKETCVYYQEDCIKISKSLTELEEQLSPHGFFRNHRKYLVNLERVREFDSCHLTLDNGKTLPVSSRKSGEFKKRLYRFLSEG